MEITFLRPDGEACPAYLAEPDARDDARRSIVIIHEMWGVTSYIRTVADRCAEEGYRVLVPDLFRGKLARDVPHGLSLMAELDWSEAASEDVRGAAQWLGREGSAVAAMGFCMGGALSLMSAERVPELASAVCFYGIPPLEAANPAAIHIPLLAHFARRDDWCTPAKVEVLERQLRAGGVEHEVHHYDADHAFMNYEGHGYSKPAAELAWSRTQLFLTRTLEAKATA